MLRYSPAALAAIVLTVMACAAHANPRNGNWPNWYVGTNMQLSYVQDADLEFEGTNIGDIDFDTEVGLGIALGFRPYYSNSFLDNTRLELEYTYRDLPTNQLESAAVIQSLEGALTAQSVMVNAFYDFNTNAKLTPYVGAGIGLANIEMDIDSIQVADDDTVFAYQAMAGVSYAPSSIPRTEFGVGYRYFGTRNPEFQNSRAQSFEHPLDTHNLEFHGRFRF